MTKKNTKTENLPFEEALKQLETIVERLESGNVPLAETLQAFEQGMKLVEHCHAQLNHAESKLKKLVRNKEGSLITEEMELDDNQAE